MILSSALLLLLLQSSVGGVVVNASSGEPLANVRVSLARTDMPLEAFAQQFTGRGPQYGETTISAEILAASKDVVEAAVLDATDPDLQARAAVYKALPLENIFEIVVSPKGEVAVVPKTSPPVTTDGSGRFTFNDIEPGTYKLTFSGNGYAKGGAPFIVGTGQAKTDLVMKLLPTGAVSGHIRNDAGEPLAGVQVEIVRFTYDQGGQKQIQSVAATFSDDRGEFRMFYLTPGRYFLRAGGQAGIRLFAAPGYSSSNVSRQSYGVTYYPGVAAEADRAGVIDVQPGSDVRDVDLRVGLQKTYLVRGRVVDPSTGQPPASISISLAGRSDNLASVRILNLPPNYKPADGSFLLANIDPGTYTITATPRRTQPLPDTSTLSPAERASFFESMEASDRAQPRAVGVVDVVNANVEGVVLTMGTSVPLAGRWRIESTAPQASVQFTLLRLELKGFGSGSLAKSMTTEAQYRPAAADGTFRIDNVLPGVYKLDMLPVPAGFYVKDARFGNTDVLNGPLIVSGPSSNALEILLSPNVGTISGDALDGSGQPLPGADVVLIPAQKHDRPDLFRSATTDPRGRYTIPSVAPGEYTLAGWEALAPYGYFDPELIAQAERAGKAVRISESSNQSANATVMPALGQ